jgi:hypothetical protein
VNPGVRGRRSPGGVMRPGRSTRRGHREAVVRLGRWQCSGGWFRGGGSTSRRHDGIPTRTRPAFRHRRAERWCCGWRQRSLRCRNRVVQARSRWSLGPQPKRRIMVGCRRHLHQALIWRQHLSARRRRPGAGAADLDSARRWRRPIHAVQPPAKCDEVRFSETTLRIDRMQ